MSLLIHAVQAVCLIAALVMLRGYSRTEDITFLVASGVCVISAGLSLWVGWPWLPAAGLVITILLLLVTAGGRGAE